MHKSYLFLGTFLFSNSIFALEKLPMSHTGLEKLKMQEIGYVIKNFLPDSNVSRIDWDYKSNDQSIIWLHKPYFEQRFKTAISTVFHS